MQTIFINNYTLVSKHGYYKEEHYKPQRFTVSVSCEVKDSKNNDDLNDTLNYENIRNAIKDVILGEHKKLLETLANEINEKILKYKNVIEVSTTITKPDIWGDCEPGVTIKLHN